MFGWYVSLTSLEQCFALVAVAASTLLFLQTGLQIMGFIGQEASFDDADSDFDGDASEFELPDSDLEDLPDADFDDLPDDDAALPDDDASPDAHEATAAAPEPALRLFTMRSMVAFFALFGWSGLVALQSRYSLPLVFAIAFAAGAAGSYCVAKMMQIFLRLQESGNVEPENAVGLEAEVYLRIPAENTGRGKVTLTLQERFVELDAVTRHHSDLPPGSKVIVVGTLDEDTLIVRPSSR